MGNRSAAEESVASLRTQVPSEERCEDGLKEERVSLREASWLVDIRDMGAVADDAAGPADMSLTEEEARVLIDLGKRLEEAMAGADESPADDEGMDDAIRRHYELGVVEVDQMHLLSLGDHV